MSWRASLSLVLHEVRITLCQTSQASMGARFASALPQTLGFTDAYNAGLHVGGTLFFGDILTTKPDRSNDNPSLWNLW